MMFTACGGGNETVEPPLTHAASLRGVVVFTPEVPLGPPPAHVFDGAPPPGVRYGARIVDPGDDIGGLPIPTPSTMLSTGEYEFINLYDDPLAYFNVLFTVADDLEGGDSGSTPVSLNVPVALIEGFDSQLSCTISRPAETVLQMIYTYSGPDGARSTYLRLDFLTDLLTFDLDGDGVYDDLTAIDRNHDAIPDEQVPFMKTFDPDTEFETYGLVIAVGSHSLTLFGATFDVWGNTNIMSSADGASLSLSEVSIGANATVNAVNWNSGKVALSIELLPDPTDPQGVFKVKREGVIEQIDETSIFVDGVKFQDYHDAEIKDQLGNSVDPGDLEVGWSAAVIGVRAGQIVKAESIIVKEVVHEPSFIEREGPILALDPEDAPERMTVDGVVFKLTGETIVKDLSGQTLDTSYLVVGNPVWVVGHQVGEKFIADMIELKYTVAPPGTAGLEVVVIARGGDAVSDAEAAIAMIETEVPVALVEIATYPLQPDDPDCLDLVLWQLTNQGDIDILNNAQEAGVIKDAIYVRAEGDECSVLVLIKDGYLKEAEAFMAIAFPNGIAGSPIVLDVKAGDPYYGDADEYAEAVLVSDALVGMLGDQPGSFPAIYVSSDVTFSGG